MPCGPACIFHLLHCPKQVRYHEHYILALWGAGSECLSCGPEIESFEECGTIPQSGRIQIFVRILLTAHVDALYQVWSTINIVRTFNLLTFRIAQSTEFKHYFGAFYDYKVCTGVLLWSGDVNAKLWTR